MVAVVHGLAASIRSAEESETFDLAGQNATTISSTILSAFQEPFLRQTIDTSTNMMLRITVIVGAGKQARQKYDDNATKAVATALTSCGYTEDRAASCIMDCAGCYKLQHDTAKNVKTIVIFPKINLVTSDQLLATSGTSSNAPPLIPIDSPDFKIAIASMPVFTNMIKSKCQSLMQKKVCLQCVEKLILMVENLDTKLISGTGLDESEQAFYDIVCNLDTKIKFLRDEITKQIDCGQITKYEKDLLLQQNSEKINELVSDNSNSKKQLLDKALLRKQKLESIVPMEKEYKLKYDTEIRALQKELVPLLQFYEQNKNKLLNNVQDSYKMTRKDEIEREIIQLEQSSRGWFEDDNEFRSKVQASRDVLTTALCSNSKKQQAIPKSYAAAIGRKDSSSPDKSYGSNANSKPGTKWVVPTEMGKTFKATKGKKRQGGGSLFGAMMMDSDSEDDDDVVAATKTMTSSNTKDFAPAPNPNVEMKQKKSAAMTATASTGNNKKKNVFSTITMDDSDSDENNDTMDNVTTGPRTSASQQNGGDKHSIKKKNKKKKNTQNNNSIDDDKVLNEEYKKVKRREDKAIAAKKKELENEHMIVSIVRVTGTIIVEILMAVILWVVQHVFGRSGNTKPKKQKQ